MVTLEETVNALCALEHKVAELEAPVEKQRIEIESVRASVFELDLQVNEGLE